MKKGFTIIEIIIVVLLISGGLLTVVDALKNSSIYLQKTRQKIIAINLAREGMEQVMNIRNTNRQKRAGQKEQTRLKTNPFVDEWPAWLENDPRFGSGNYIMLSNTTGWQQYFYASGISNNLDITLGYSDTGNRQYSLCESGGIWRPCPGLQPVSKEWYYFRRIQWYWTFQKETTTPGGIYLNCLNGSSSPCGDNTAKEFRFCSVVEYIGNSLGKVELCSVITNFKE